MSKAVIVFEDGDTDGAIRMSVIFDPELQEGQLPSAAQREAIRFLEMVESSVENDNSIEVQECIIDGERDTLQGGG